MRKLLIAVTVVLLAGIYGSGAALAFSGGDQDCLKCHFLNADQAKEALKALIPDITIINVGPAPLKGLWEIGMESGGKKGILYLDFSKKNLIAGNIFDIKTRTSYTQESLTKISKVDFSQIPLENSVVMGDKDAKYKIVVFDDPD